MRVFRSENSINFACLELPYFFLLVNGISINMTCPGDLNIVFNGCVFHFNRPVQFIGESMARLQAATLSCFKPGIGFPVRRQLRERLFGTVSCSVENFQ